MAIQMPAIDGLSDATQGRVVLHQSGQLVSAPATAIGLQPLNANLTAIGNITPTDGNFIVGNGTTWVAESGATARTSLGLGTMATQNANAVAITGGTINGTTVGTTTPATGAFTTLSATGLITASGGQIAFPATQVPSADPNTLDDYEEGTWTPVLQFGGASTGITYTTQEGFYTKTGRAVAPLEGEILLSSNGTATGSATVIGLPFSAARDSAPVGAYISGFTGLTAGGFLATNPGSGTLLCRSNLTTGSAATAETAFLDTARIFFGGGYSV